MEKQSFALIKAIKDFRVYILHSNIISYVPNVVVKDILTQNGPDGKRGKWIAIILEYDMEIKPTKLIKGQGLAKFMAESNFNALDINFVVALDDKEEKATPQLDEAFMTSPWYANLIFVLFNLNAPPSLTKTKVRFLKIKVVKFCIIDNILYWKYAGGVLLKCLLKYDAKRKLQEFHEDDCSGHIYWKNIVNKILIVGFYSLTIFPDFHKKVTSCHKCQILEGKKKTISSPSKAHLC